MEHICDLCLISSKTLGDFNAHMTLHKRENINVCNTCDNNISQSETLTTHIMTQHKKKTFACSQCRKRETFTEPSCLKTYNITHNVFNQFSCSSCGNIFSKYRDLKRHQRTHSGVKYFVCSKCKKSLSVYDDIKTNKQCLKKGYAFSCSECDKALSNTSNLAAHTKTFPDTIFFPVLTVKK